MDIKQIMNSYYKKIYKKTTVIVKNLTKELKATNLENVSDLEKILLPFVLSGKLIRGSLYLLAAKMYGHKNINNLLDIAVAIELNHSGLLIHDDIMDHDLFRRGKPSIHKIYSLLASSLKIAEKDDFGKNMAICLGDICFFGASMITEQSSLPAKTKQKVKKYYFLQLLKTGFGQMLDVKLGLSKKEPTFPEIIRVYDYKTGGYTFNSPFVMGYYSSGKKDKKEVNILEKAGYSLGRIFQITDDLIGFLKNKEIIGKDSGSDIRENKKTIVRYFLLKKLKSSEYNFARQCFGNKKLTTKDLEKLRQIFYIRKVDKIVNESILKEVINAKENINKLHVDKKYKNILLQFANHLVNRIK